MKLRKINSIIESIEKYRQPETYGSEVYGNKVLEKSDFGSAVGHDMAVRDHYANLENANDALKDKTEEDSKCIDKVNSQPKEVKSDELRKMKLSEEVGRWNSSDEYMSRWIEKEITKLLDNEGISFESVHAKKNISHVEIKVLVDGGDKKKDHISLNRAVSDFLDDNSFELDGVSEENVQGDKEGIYTAYHVFDAVDRRAYSSLRESSDKIVDESMKKNNALELRKAFSKAFGEVKDGEPFAIIATNVENLRKDPKREANEEEYKKINEEAKKYLEENGKRAKGMWNTEANPDTFIIKCDLDTAKSLSLHLTEESTKNESLEDDDVATPKKFTNGKLEDFDLEELIGIVKERQEPVNSIREDDEGNIYFIIVDGRYDANVQTGKNMIVDVVKETPEGKQKRILSIMDLSSWDEIKKEFNEWKNSVVRTSNEDIVEEGLEEAPKQIERALSSYIPKKLEVLGRGWEWTITATPREVIAEFGNEYDEYGKDAHDMSRVSTDSLQKDLQKYLQSKVKKYTVTVKDASFIKTDYDGIAGVRFRIDTKSKRESLDDSFDDISHSLTENSKESFKPESIKEEDDPICNDDDIDCEMDDEPYFDDSTEDKSFDFEDDEPIYWGD